MHKLSSSGSEADAAELRAGVSLQMAGRPEEAALRYRCILERSADHPDALHLLGVALHEQDRSAAGLPFIEQAIAINPASEYYHNSHGNVLCALGRHAEAVAAYRSAVALQPSFVEALVNLGNALQEERQLDEAVRLYAVARRLRPNVPQIHNNLGNALRALGRTDDALAALQRALELSPEYPEAWLNLGNCRRDTNEFEEAERCYRNALRLAPELAAAHSNLAALCLALERYRDAEQHAAEAVRIAPASVEARINLASSWVELKRAGEAGPLIERLLSVAPTSPAVHNLHGRVLSESKQWAAATEAFQRAVTLDSDFADAWYHLGNAHQQLLELEESDHCYRTAMRLRPQEPKIHWNRAHTLLLSGRWLEAWPEYEWRWKRRQMPPRPLPGQRWSGEPIAGRRIFVYTEQGLGDAIQFARYLPLVKQLGAHVLFECHRRLVPLFQSLECVDELSAGDDPLPEFDHHVPLMSLPGQFGTTPATVPTAVPYLPTGTLLPATVAARLEALPGFRVGLAWGANPASPSGERRTVPVDSLNPLREIAGISFISLQRDAPDVPAFCHLVEEPQGSICDTAALLERLDLVITVDTMLAHLSGALGRPVWTLLPDVPDWRWLLGRDDTPWYPSMRLFRQSRAGDWSDVLARVCAALDTFSKNKLKCEEAGR